MNKTLVLFIMISLSFGLLVASAHAAAPMATGYEKQYQFSEIVRTYVMNPQGQFLGRISDIAFDSEGHVSFLTRLLNLSGNGSLSDDRYNRWLTGLYQDVLAIR